MCSLFFLREIIFVSSSCILESQEPEINFIISSARANFGCPNRLVLLLQGVLDSGKLLHASTSSEGYGLLELLMIIANLGLQSIFLGDSGRDKMTN